MADGDHELRLRLTLSGAAPLDEELGSFGLSVASRADRLTGGRERQDQRENFCLRRLLVAWDRLKCLERPIEVTASKRGGPDFALHWADGRRLGVEVTQAASEESQRETTRWELSESDEVDFVPSPGGDGFVGSVQDHAIAAEIRRAVEAKLGHGYPRPVHLLVYENSGASFLADTQTIVSDLKVDRAFANDASARFEEVHLILGSLVIVDLLGRTRLVDLTKAYEIDYSAWLDGQVEAIRLGNRSALDLQNIAEELAGLGKSERRQAESHLLILLMHLLKWQFQPAMRSGSWRLSVRNARRTLARVLSESPSLRRHVHSYLPAGYMHAREDAADETGLKLEAFPASCPYSLEQLLDPDFMPE